MNRLDHLQTIADRKLGGLNATPKMLVDIKIAAAGRAEKKGPHFSLRPVLAVCTVALLCLGYFTVALDTPVPGGPVGSPSLLDSQPAGDAVEHTPAQSFSERALLDVPPGSISLGSANDVPAYHNIFAEGQGGNFPLVMVNGATYRLLKSPSSVSNSLLGENLGEVIEYSLEPALSTGGVVSNTVSQGRSVYAIAGMSGAMVAAPVDGTMRAFQRVSFSGSAIIGSESLGDTLCSVGSVVSMELSGVGAIDDAQLARDLMQILLSEASYQSASVSSGGSQSLLIGLSNGLTLQLMVGDDTVSACGTWSCPEFFEEFLIAMES